MSEPLKGKPGVREYRDHSYWIQAGCLKPQDTWLLLKAESGTSLYLLSGQVVHKHIPRQEVQKFLPAQQSASRLLPELC